MPSFDHFSIIASLYARASYSKLNQLREFASLPARGRLLDVGGGTGRVSSVLGDLVDEVVVVDLSFSMLKKALHFPLRLVCSYSEILPFAGSSFDRIIMVDALHHVVDQAQSIREMLRVLKPEGVLVIEEPDIRTFGVKLIALAEKLLLMRSHFLEPDNIRKFFADGDASIKTDHGTAWVIIQKKVAQ